MGGGKRVLGLAGDGVVMTLTWGTELSGGGGPRGVQEFSEGTSLGDRPWTGASSGSLGPVVQLHAGGALRQVLAVVAQAILGDLNRVEVALWAPLCGHWHS